MDYSTLLHESLEKIRSMIDVKTIICDPVVNNNDVKVIPVAKMSLGFAELGGETEGKKTKPDDRLPMGGIGAGANIQPIGFLTVSGERVRFVTVEGGETSWEQRLQNVLDLFVKD